MDRMKYKISENVRTKTFYKPKFFFSGKWRAWEMELMPAYHFRNKMTVRRLIYNKMFLALVWRHMGKGL